MFPERNRRSARSSSTRRPGVAETLLNSLSASSQSPRIAAQRAVNNAVSSAYHQLLRQRDSNCIAVLNSRRSTAAAAVLIMKYSETCRMLSTNTRPTTTNRSHFCRISSGTLLTLAPPLHQPCELHHLNGNQTAGVRSFLECKPPLCSGFRKPLSRSLPQQLLNACLSPVLPK